MIEDELISSMARTMWVCAWADWNDRCGDVPTSGRELMDIAPDTPPRAELMAAVLLGRYIALNGDGYGPEVMVSQLARADDVQFPYEPEWIRDLGHYLVMMALGHGVSWFDDHGEADLYSPSLEVDVSEFFTDAEWRGGEAATYDDTEQSHENN